MPQVTPIPQLLTMDNDMAVYAVKGKIKSLFRQRTSKPDAAKQWTCQDLLLMDATHSIKVQVWDHEPLPEAQWKGKAIYLLATHGDKGWTGLKVKDNTWEGTTTKVLSVTRTGEIAEATVYESGQAGAPAPQAPTPPSPPPTAPLSTHSTQAELQAAAAAVASAVPPPPPERGNSHSPVEIRLAGLARAYLRCMDAATFVAVEFQKKHGATMSPDQFQGCTATLFIAGQRENLF